jgi:hypothetical protein
MRQGLYQEADRFGRIKGRIDPEIRRDGSEQVSFDLDFLSSGVEKVS